MKPCIVIPCFNHAATVAEVAGAARAHCPVFVVDDGSRPPVPQLPGCTVVRLDRNCGKGAALRAGFARAGEDGFTHAVTLDADGQHHTADVPKFLAVAREQPEALAVGVRDFIGSGAPAGRRRSNAVSTFWFRVETGVRLSDTQCGFRCYPLGLALRLKTRSERYAFELEMLVRAAWTGAPIRAVPIACSYRPEQLRQSHFRPIIDLALITAMNIGLVLQSWVVPQDLRRAWSLGEDRKLRQVVGDVFCEHAHEPSRLAGAVALGLFCGIAPIWGYQMLAAAWLAHLLRLNKAIALLASNISVWPLTPFVLYGALWLGHWLFTGEGLNFSPHLMTRARALQYVGHWFVGSLVLGAMVAALGALSAYVVARRWRPQ